MDPILGKLVMKSMMIAPGDTVRIVGPTICGDVELLGKIGKISEETPMGRFMVEGDTYRCFPISSLKPCRELETQLTYDSIQEELTTIKKMLARISEKMDKLLVDCTTSEKAVLRVGDWVQVNNTKSIYCGYIFPIEKFIGEKCVETTIHNKIIRVCISHVRLLDRQEMFDRMNTR